MSNLFIDMSAQSSRNNAGLGLAYESSVSLVADGNSSAILIPIGVKDVMVTVVPAGGSTAKVQTSTDLIDTIKNGTVTWSDWGAGAVASATTGVAYPVTAIRLVQGGAGSSKMTVKAQ